MKLEQPIEVGRLARKLVTRGDASASTMLVHRRGYVICRVSTALRPAWPLRQQPRIAARLHLHTRLRVQERVCD